MSYDTYGSNAAGPGDQPEFDAAVGRPGIAWEQRADLGPGVAFVRTIKQVLLSPAAAFSEMHLEGGWAEPLGFAVVIGSVCIWVAQMWDMLTRSLFAGVTGLDIQQLAAANAQEIWFALMAPLLVAGSTFFAAAIVHVLLIMFGGAPRPYEATFRVFCYSWSVGVFNLIPICGVFVGTFWRIVVQIIGVREAHGVPTGKAAAAVLIPVILACFCLLLLLITAVGLAGLTQLAP